MEKAQNFEETAKNKAELYPDMTSYIEANKKIVIPSESMGETEERMKIKINKGDAWFTNNSLYFVDEENNLAQVYIDYDKIVPTKDNPRIHFGSQTNDAFTTELKKCGLALNVYNDSAIYEAVVNYQASKRKDERKKGEDMRAKEYENKSL